MHTGAFVAGCWLENSHDARTARMSSYLIYQLSENLFREIDQVITTRNSIRILRPPRQGRQAGQWLSARYQALAVNFC